MLFFCSKGVNNEEERIASRLSGDFDNYNVLVLYARDGCVCSHYEGETGAGRKGTGRGKKQTGGNGTEYCRNGVGKVRTPDQIKSAE